MVVDIVHTILFCYDRKEIKGGLRGGSPQPHKNNSNFFQNFFGIFIFGHLLFVHFLIDQNYVEK
jgi:hypothetical protein